MLDTLINDYNNIYRYELKGRIPAKKDSQRIFKNKKGKSFITSSQSHSVWEPEAIQKLWLQKFHPTIDKCLGIVITLFYGDLRSKDNTNTADSVMDALVKAKVIKDDNWKVTGALILIPKYEKGMFGAEINIYC